jgi:hypothetical protein
MPTAMTAARRAHLARELNTRVKYLRLTGLDGPALVEAMAGRMGDVRALMEGAEPDGMDGLARLPDLWHLAALLARSADRIGIQEGKTEAPG